jgi:hypothetical protein
MKVPLTSIYDDLNFASERLSTQIRTLTFGTLALTWLFLTGSKDVTPLHVPSHSRWLLGIAFLCVLTLLIDATQYWSFYLSANSVRKHAEAAHHHDAEYDETSVTRRLQQTCFWLKQVTAACAAIGLLVILATAVFGSTTSSAAAVCLVCRRNTGSAEHSLRVPDGATVLIGAIDLGSKTYSFLVTRFEGAAWAKWADDWKNH